MRCSWGHPGQWQRGFGKRHHPSLPTHHQRTCGISGAKPCRYTVLDVVSAIAPYVRPWKPPCEMLVNPVVLISHANCDRWCDHSRECHHVAVLCEAECHSRRPPLPVASAGRARPGSASSFGQRFVYATAKAVALLAAIVSAQSSRQLPHLEADDVGAPGGGARQLDGVVHHLATAVGEEEAVEALRHDAVQAVDEPDLRGPVSGCHARTVVRFVWLLDL